MNSRFFEGQIRGRNIGGGWRSRRLWVKLREPWRHDAFDEQSKGLGFLLTTQDKHDAFRPKTLKGT